MINLAKQAREIRDQFFDSDKILQFRDIHPNAKAYFVAEGYLAALNGPEVLALVEAARHCLEKESIVYHDGTPWNECFENCRCCALEKALAQYREAVKP